MSKNKFIRRKKDSMKTILVILILLIGVGYAYINTNLNINGTANINSASWNVHWANVQVSSGSVSANTPTISNQTTVNYTVTLNQPGDYYEFTVDAVNSGTLDAMIDTISSKLNGVTITTLPAYLKYSVTYEDGTPLEPNQELKVNTTEKYKIRIEYNVDINANQIPATNQALSLQFTVTYRQATDEAFAIKHTRYTFNLDTNNKVYIGQPIPNIVPQFSSYDELVASGTYPFLGGNYANFPFSLKHIIQDGIVTENYVEFVITEGFANLFPGSTPGTYTIRGAGATKTGNTYNNDSIYYEQNKQTLIAAYGSSHCNEYSSSHLYMCYFPGYGSSDGYRASVAQYGSVSVGLGDGGYGCYVNSDGGSSCS